jgi:hypothetical protein
MTDAPFKITIQAFQAGSLSKSQLVKQCFSFERMRSCQRARCAQGVHRSDVDVADLVLLSS